MALNIILSILLLASALFLIVAVLLQNGKSKGLSGTITGGAETFFGKNKGKTIDKKLSLMTTIVAIVFVVLVIVVFVTQDYYDWWDQFLDGMTTGSGSGLTSDTASGLINDTASGLVSDTTSGLTTDIAGK